ncbi:MULTISPECIES: type 2 periplasmic-binding domain-containing protein [Sphingobium]|uniref:hypothetical protein n=1 Tax=Sphingobium sp. MI1205 TaxID=407020 RepID=UPI0007701CE2|nr:hypothetical protein [Sphingobium sp. MI1205]AMK17139.1 LysR family transcriptional regulator [Sphingobium sp. MI1205]
MKRLTDNLRMLCASPAYLQRRGVPACVSDLAVHDNVVVGPVQQEIWRSIAGAGPPRVTLTPQ